MANTRELRRRIRSVKNTSQITKAMQMVAATKMRKAQTQALSGRPYNQNLNFALSKLISRIEKGKHGLIKENESGSVGIVLLTTDKSLCGALNTNTFRTLQNFIKEKFNEKELVFFTIGKKGRNFLVRTGRNLEADFENQEVVTFRQSSQISKLLISSYLDGVLKEVYLIYPDFISTLRQEPKIVKLLPVDSFYLLETLTGNGEEVKKKDINNEMLIEPNVDELLDEILLHFVKTKVYQALLETKASEHSARMIAMRNATDNAKELVEDLKLTYNQTRQDAITRELLEITSASAALE